MNYTEAAAEIARVDRELARIHEQLAALEPIEPLSAASWQDAWDKHPDLHAFSAVLWRQRGELQLIRDNEERAHVRSTFRTKRAADRCPTCGSPVFTDRAASPMYAGSSVSEKKT